MRKNKVIRVLICNQYTLFREGIKALLAKNELIQIVGEAETTQKTLSLVERTHPDVVLMDAAPADSSGSAATRKIKAVNPRVAILILSLTDDKPLIVSCLRAGAEGYIRNGARSFALKNAIQTAGRRAAHAA